MPVRVAVDAVGGDHAPGVVIDGALQALGRSDGRLVVALVGPEEAIREALADLGASESTPGLSIVDAPEVIGMEESPAAALKGKPRSSIHVGVGAVRDGHADAFASAGNTGAVMAAATFLLGRLPGVLRPAIPGTFPTTRGSCLVVDVGANVDCKPEHLVQFARMGKIYAERVLGLDAPAVALLSVGEEPTKGNEAVKEAHERLRECSDVNFVGNVEGRDLLQHAADVCVCDGFTGNIVLKLAESVATVLPALVRNEVAAQGLSLDEAALVGRVLRGTMAPFEYENFGGLPLLGIAGAVIIGHGGSSARAIEQMILRAAEVVEQGVTPRIAEALGGVAVG
jgi:glycerol-3-phosphate acyltransferase PlsX